MEEETDLNGTSGGIIANTANYTSSETPSDNEEIGED